MSAKANDGDSQLKLSPVVPTRGVDIDSPVTNHQCNPPSNYQSQTPTLPPRTDETDLLPSPAQDKGHQAQNLLPQDESFTSRHLPGNQPHKLRSVDEKHPEDASGPRHKNLPNLDKGKPKVRALTLLSSNELAQKELSLDQPKSSTDAFPRAYRKTEPALKKKRSRPRESAPLFFPPSQWSSRYGIQFFTVKIVSVEVVEDPEKGPKGSYAVYKLEIKRGRQVITRHYRYSQFADFHKALLCSSITILLQQGRIFLPAKTWFRNVSPEFLEKRRLELEKYLHKLLQYKYSPRDVIVQRFLALNEFVVKDFWIDH